MSNPFPAGMGVPPDRGWDEDYEFEDHPPTFEDAVRLWKQGREWYKDDTLYGIAEFASYECADEPWKRHVWVESVRYLERTGLFTREVAIGLIHAVLERFFSDCHHMDDSVLEAIGDEMCDLCRRHGLPDGADFTPHPHPPQEWLDLNARYDAREEEIWGDVLVGCGERELWELRRTRKAEYDAIVTRVDRWMRQDWEDARRTRYGKDWETPGWLWEGVN